MSSTIVINCYNLFPYSSLTLQISHKPSQLWHWWKTEEGLLLMQTFSHHFEKNKLLSYSGFCSCGNISFKGHLFHVEFPDFTSFCYSLPWQQSMEAKEAGTGARLPGFKCQLCYLWAVWPWANCLTSLCFSVIIGKTSMIILPILVLFQKNRNWRKAKFYHSGFLSYIWDYSMENMLLFT